jgi:hypothetical protein
LSEQEDVTVKYALNVEVKLVELPDDEQPEEIRPGSDPMQSMVKVMTGAMGTIARPAIYGPPAGFDFRKQITVSVHNFAALAAIIGRFDELTTDIEHEKLQV